MTEKEYRQCIAEALLPKYHQILAEADSSYEFSPDFERRMDKLIRQRRKPYYRFINTSGKRVAVILLAFLTISFTTVMSVEALRTPFLDFITSIFSDHSEVRANDDSGDYPETIENYYEITSGLSDYIIERDTIKDNERVIYYRRNEQLIYYHQITIKNYLKYYNTENTEIENIDINGHEAIGYIDNQNYYTLIWNNGEYVIQISSNIGKDALIEIAKSVQKAEK